MLHLAGPLAVGVVVVVAVEHQHAVGVGFDLAGFAQVGEQRAFVGALLDGAGELRDGDHRAGQFAGEALEAAAELRDVIDPAARGAFGAHQLQVVDDDEARARRGARRSVVACARRRSSDRSPSSSEVKRHVVVAPRGVQQRGPVVGR